MKRRGGFGLKLGAITVLLACIPISYQVLYRMPNQSRAERIDRELSAAIVDFRNTGPVVRPVLRGEAVEGNAAEALLSASEPLAAVEIGSGEFGPLLEGRASDSLVAQARQVDSTLQRVRGAAQRNETWTELHLERGANAAHPEYVPVLTALKLLLALATAAPAQECLQVAADVVRLGQDLRPGGGLVAAVFSVVVIGHAVPVFARCSDRATGDELRAAMDEIEHLLQEHPDIGPALEAEALFSGAMMQELTATPPFFPTSGEELDSIRNWPTALEAADMLASEPAQFRAVTARDMPESAEIWYGHERSMAASRNELLTMVAPSTSRFIDREMHGVALLRALVRALRFRTEQNYDMGFRPHLADPFNGEGMRFDRDHEAGTVTFSAVGPDGNDDRCADGSDDACVTVSAESLYGQP